MNSTKKQPNKFTRFLRNNAALLLLIFSVLAITAVVLAVTLTRDVPVLDDPVVNNPNDDEPGNTKPGDDGPTTPGSQKIEVSFRSPINYTNTGLDYTGAADHLFVFKSTLNEWSVHKAADLLAADGTEVVAMFDGTVLDAGYSFLKGYYVTVDHGEGVVATYASLADLQVSRGAEIKQGATLGYVSTSAENEYHEGAHLHLEVKENNKLVDPMPYVLGEISREIEVKA